MPQISKQRSVHYFGLVGYRPKYRGMRPVSKKAAGARPWLAHERNPDQFAGSESGATTLA
jgi:hypothetical protein